MKEEQHSAGSLGLSTYSNPDLAGFPTEDLAAELLGRLERADLTRFSEHRYLGALSAQISLVSRATHNRLSPQRSALMLTQLVHHPDFELDALAGATCVDAGCGNQNPVGPLLVTLMAGAHRGIGIELERPQSAARGVMALYNAVSFALAGGYAALFRSGPREILDRLHGFDLRKLADGDPTGIAPGRLELRNVSIESTGLEDGEVDVLASNSFLEHVEDARACLQEMARITRPGAIIAHAVDYADHRHYGSDLHPLDFLRHDPDAVILHGCNRLRHHQILGFFEESGFAVRRFDVRQRVDVSSEEIGTFGEPFRSMTAEQLAPLNVMYYLRRT